MRGVAQIRFNPKTNELIAADGYGNKRVSVWDADTLKFKRHWGAYGKTPTIRTPGRTIPSAPVAQQFRNPVHCAQPSNDGLIYVCDRVNDRIQVFKTDGTFVKEVFVLKNTKGDGSVWEIAFSKDPEQKFMYIADGANEQDPRLRPPVDEGDLQRSAAAAVSPVSSMRVHSIVTDSKGNIYTTETYRGQRVQKFIYKGHGPVAGDYAALPGRRSKLGSFVNHEPRRVKAPGFFL